MNVQLAANVLLITPVDADGESVMSKRYILAAEGTPFVKYCQIGEHLIGTQGEIVRQFLMPLPPPPRPNRPTSPVGMHDATTADDDIDYVAEGEDVSSGITGMLGRALGMESPIDHSPALPMRRVVPPPPQRTMDERGSDAVVATGDAALVDGGTTDAHKTLRRRGPAEAEGDATTYSVAVDTGAGASAQGTPPLPQRPTFTPAGAAASSIVIPVDAVGEQEFRWVRIDRVELWSSFAVFRAVHAMEGGLVQAIKTGRLDASPGADIAERVDAWSQTYASRIRAREVATDLLVHTLETNRAGLHPNIRGLLDAVQATSDQLIPRPQQ